MATNSIDSAVAAYKYHWLEDCSQEDARDALQDWIANYRDDNACFQRVWEAIWATPQAAQ